MSVIFYYILLLYGGMIIYYILLQEETILSLEWNRLVCKTYCKKKQGVSVILVKKGKQEKDEVE